MTLLNQDKYFQFIYFKKNLKISISAVGKQYMVCTLLRNALTCFMETASEYFQLDPPYYWKQLCIDICNDF